MRKRIISLALVFVMAFCLCVPAAAAYTENVEINYRAIKLVLNGEAIVPCDAAGKTVEPFIMRSNGTTYLPLRAVAQALGLDVKWDGATNTVTLTSGGEVKVGAGPAGTTTGKQSVDITYRDIKVFLDGEELNLVNVNGDKVEPFILKSNSSVYLPLRVVGEALGLEVGWDSKTSTVSLVGTNDESGVKGISLNETNISYKPGETFELVATVSPDDAADKTVTWYSSDETIATVSSSGLVTMVKPGTAVITAKTVNGKTAKCEVTVLPIEVSGITLSESNIRLEAGKTQQLTATVFPDDATNKTVTWTSSNAAVAKVSSSGVVTAIRTGNATITAKSGNVSASCSIEVYEIPWYSESMYCVGRDIPAGDYYAVATSGSGYYCKYTDSTQDDIEANDNFSTFTYFRAYEGQYLKLSRCKITPIENAPVVSGPSNGFYGEGMYRVGIDIPAGDYYAVATSGSGYYCKYTDITQDDIEANDNFSTFTYFRAYEGQYLKLSRCKITSIENAPVVSAPDNGLYDVGMYRVGIDIPAGEYKFTATSGSGYYCVYTDITQNDIEDNENFKSVVYYTVRNGQFLKVNRAQFQYLGAPDTPDTPNIPDTPTTPSEPSTPTTPSEPSKPTTPDINYGEELAKYVATRGSTVGKVNKQIKRTYSTSSGSVETYITYVSSTGILRFGINYVYKNISSYVTFDYDYEDMVASPSTIMATFITDSFPVTSFSCTANFNIASYSDGTDLNYAISGSTVGNVPANYRELSNSTTEVAVAAWAKLIDDTVGFSLADIGFTSY